MDPAKTIQFMQANMERKPTPWQVGKHIELLALHAHRYQGVLKAGGHYEIKAVHRRHYEVIVPGLANPVSVEKRHARIVDGEFGEGA